MKRIVFLTLLLTLAGCATTTGGSTYRKPGATEAWQISGARVFGLANDTIEISVNGEKALSVEVNSFNFQGSGRAKYRGSVLAADCRRVQMTMRQAAQCIVTVDNELAATLTF